MQLSKSIILAFLAITAVTAVPVARIGKYPPEPIYTPHPQTVSIHFPAPTPGLHAQKQQHQQRQQRQHQQQRNQGHGQRKNAPQGRKFPRDVEMEEIWVI
ncbi:hypothetical protein CPB86DRAFT_819503 [Serendipita vermifera]|nr:hypothetical protein CPB86DRAFT_819503 [Serendipita vermifera]